VGNDDGDIGKQVSCVNIASGTSTAWTVRDLIISGGPQFGGILNSFMLTVDGTTTGGVFTQGNLSTVTGMYNLRLPSGDNRVNGGGSLTIGGALQKTGAVAASGSTTIDLASFLPTPPSSGFGSGYGWWVKAGYNLALAYSGSDGAAHVEVMKTATASSASVLSSLGILGSGYVSGVSCASNDCSVITITNQSGTNSVTYYLTLEDVECML
jgi:hypothetical protein